MKREVIDYDIVIVGAGPAGLACAIRLRQLARAGGLDLSVCVLEKGSVAGAHILSGAVFEPRALAELIPDWQDLDAPVRTGVSADQFFLLTGPTSSISIPGLLLPAPLKNAGKYVISLGLLCRWLAQRAEQACVDIFPGFPAAELCYDETGAVSGVITGDMGVARDGSPKDTYQPGMMIRAKYTVLAEGSRGHLGRQAITRFGLSSTKDPQHYAIGLKEIWQVPASVHSAGKVMHAVGWPLQTHGGQGGFFLYHMDDNQVAIGAIIDLSYKNPHLSPYDEFQLFKHHGEVSKVLAQGKRTAFGARSITKGGLHSLPKMSMPGALLTGCDAGTLNGAMLKGTHTAMKSGMLAAETLFQALSQGDGGGRDLSGYNQAIRQSWVYDELYRARNFSSALHKFGTIAGSCFNFIDQKLFQGRLPVALHDHVADHEATVSADQAPVIDYPVPDGVISFDRLSSVYLSSTNHAEDQPSHLLLENNEIPVSVNLARYAGLEQRYCPARVYEFIDSGTGKRLQVNAQNCLHCKTCDIKDPNQNITWVTPEGGGGPNYRNM